VRFAFTLFQWIVIFALAFMAIILGLIFDKLEEADRMSLMSIVKLAAIDDNTDSIPGALKT